MVYYRSKKKYEEESECRSGWCNCCCVADEEDCIGCDLQAGWRSLAPIYSVGVSSNQADGNVVYGRLVTEDEGLTGDPIYYQQQNIFLQDPDTGFWNCQIQQDYINISPDCQTRERFILSYREHQDDPPDDPYPPYDIDEPWEEKYQAEDSVAQRRNLYISVVKQWSQSLDDENDFADFVILYDNVSEDSTVTRFDTGWRDRVKPTQGPNWVTIVSVSWTTFNHRSTTFPDELDLFGCDYVECELQVKDKPTGLEYFNTYAFCKEIWFYQAAQLQDSDRTVHRTVQEALVDKTVEEIVGIPSTVLLKLQPPAWENMSGSLIGPNLTTAFVSPSVLEYNIPTTGFVYDTPYQYVVTLTGSFFRPLTHIVEQVGYIIHEFIFRQPPPVVPVTPQARWISSVFLRFTNTSGDNSARPAVSSPATTSDITAFQQNILANGRIGIPLILDPNFQSFEIGLKFRSVHAPAVGQVLELKNNSAGDIIYGSVVLGPVNTYHELKFIITRGQNGVPLTTDTYGETMWYFPVIVGKIIRLCEVFTCLPYTSRFPADASLSETKKNIFSFKQLQRWYYPRDYTPAQYETPPTDPLTVCTFDSNGVWYPGNGNTQYGLLRCAAGRSPPYGIAAALSTTHDFYNCGIPNIVFKGDIRISQADYQYDVPQLWTDWVTVFYSRHIPNGTLNSEFVYRSSLDVNHYGIITPREGHFNGSPYDAIPYKSVSFCVSPATVGGSAEFVYAAVLGVQNLYVSELTL